MCRETKQQVARAADVDAHALAGAAWAATLAASAPPAAPPPTASGTAAAAAAAGGSAPTQQPQWVGALILRGNRCVLSRSLASPPAWEGMCIPTVALRDGERAADGAVRAAAEFCDLG